MSYTIDAIATTLKNAREAKGLSQRALSELAGVPQGHISKIENGAVDLRVSSLIELARVLELELTLVPRQSVPAVNSIVRSGRDAKNLDRPGDSSQATLHALKQLQQDIADVMPLYPTHTELAQLQRQTRDLQHLPMTHEHLQILREAGQALSVLKDRGDGESIRRTLQEIQSLRNTLAHSADRFGAVEKVRPAYALEEDGDGE